MMNVKLLSGKMATGRLTLNRKNLAEAKKAAVAHLVGRGIQEMTFMTDGFDHYIYFAE